MVADQKQQIRPFLPFDGEKSSIGHGISKTAGNSENSVARLWAFITIRDILNKAGENDITKSKLDFAYSLAMKYNFLTPFTNLNFVQWEEEDEEDSGFGAEVRENHVEGRSSDVAYEDQILLLSILTYGDLSPIFYNGGMMEMWEQLQACEQPIRCDRKFHMQRYIVANVTKLEGSNETFVENDGVNCTGSITLYTKPNFQGEALTIEGESIFQLYHEKNGQRMRSIQTEGDCCWNLFDKRFFRAKTVDKICGGKNEPNWGKSIGSIKRYESTSMY